MKKAIVGFLLAASLSGPAHADPITQWAWSLDAGFTAWRDTLWTPTTSETDTTFMDAALSPASPIAGVPAYQSLTWGGGTVACPGSGRDGTCRGTDPGRSSLSVLGGSAPPNVTTVAPGTFGDWQDIGRVQHNNNVILLSSGILTSAQMVAELNLSPAVGSITPAIDIAPRRFEIQFIETANRGYNYGGVTRCAEGTEDAAGCKDIFVLQNAATALAPVDFARDGFQYTFFFDLVDADGNALGSLSAEACARAGLGAGCVGFTTFEGRINEARIRMRLLVRPLDATVPEPATMGLLGLGLAGLGWTRRRRA